MHYSMNDLVHDQAVIELAWRKLAIRGVSDQGRNVCIPRDKNLLVFDVETPKNRSAKGISDLVENLNVQGSSRRDFAAAQQFQSVDGGGTDQAAVVR